MRVVPNRVGYAHAPGQANDRYASLKERSETPDGQGACFIIRQNEALIPTV